MTSNGVKRRKQRALGVDYQESTADLVRKVAVTFWEYKSHRLKNKWEVGSTENESFKKYDIGRKEL